MTVGSLQIVALLFTAIAMGGGLAHLVDLPRNIRLSRDDYRAAQQSYRSPELLGIATAVALVATTTLAVLERGSWPTILVSLVAPVCVAASLVVLFAVTFPVSRVTQNWSVLPHGWKALRRRFELSRAANATLYLVAALALAISIAVEPL